MGEVAGAVPPVFRFTDQLGTTFQQEAAARPKHRNALVCLYGNVHYIQI